MKKYLFYITIIAYVLASCSGKTGKHAEDGHVHTEACTDEHSHETEEHDAATCTDEDHDHEIEEDTHQGHEHEEASLSFTEYSKNIELFAECNALVVGEETEILAHCTLLENHKPVESGKLTVSLVIGNNSISTFVENPEKPGIFHVELLPNKAGKGKLVFVLSTPKLNDTIEINDVEVHEDHDDAEHGHEEESKLGEISFLKEQAWKIDFETKPVLVKPFSELIATSGELMAAQGDEITIAAKNTGNFNFNGLQLTPGKFVSFGETIGFVSGNKNLSDNTYIQYAQAKAEFEKAKADFERAQNLVKDNIISQKDFMAYQLAYEHAKAGHELYSRNFDLSGIRIKSPVSGYICEIFVDQGQFVETGAPILKIAQNKKLLLRADVSQKYFSKVPSIAAANFKTALHDRVYNTQDLNGKLLSYSKHAANSHMLPVYFEMDYVEGLVPGSFVEVWLKTSKNENSVLVPTAAIMEEQGNYNVFAQLGGETYEKKYITIGVDDGLYTQVIAGLSGNERVVTKGAVRVKLASMSTALPSHGHAH